MSQLVNDLNEEKRTVTAPLPNTHICMLIKGKRTKVHWPWMLEAAAGCGVRFFPDSNGMSSANNTISHQPIIPTVSVIATEKVDIIFHHHLGNRIIVPFRIHHYKLANKDRE